MDELLILSFVGSLVALIACTVAAMMLLDRVDMGFKGALLGFFLGPLGIIIAWIIRDNELRARSEREQRHRADATFARREPVPPAASSLITELDRLAALRVAGHITDEQFNHLREQLLGEQPKSRQRFR